MLLTDVEQVGFFEGTEKLLEVWFKIPDDAEIDLRSIPRIEWEHLVESVRAEIVSCKSNEFIDSFVLSESSMFVSKNRFVIKTCGTTKLLSCVKPLMQLAKHYCNLTELQPENRARDEHFLTSQEGSKFSTGNRQKCLWTLIKAYFPRVRASMNAETASTQTTVLNVPWPTYKIKFVSYSGNLVQLLQYIAAGLIVQSTKHFTLYCVSWAATVQIRDDFFYSRRVYLKPEEQEMPHQSFNQELEYLQEIFPNGSAFVFGNTKGEEWYLYTLDDKMEGVKEPDATLEILMSDLDANTMFQFSKACYPSSEQMTKGSGIADLIPGAVHDGMVFDPIGYSMNGLLKNSYHTIHITPQPECSYVSFETNIQLKDYSPLVQRVLTTFKPGKFIITLFANKDAACGQSNTVLDKMKMNGYHCIDLEHANLKNYTLSYGHYRKVNH